MPLKKSSPHQFLKEQEKYYHIDYSRFESLGDNCEFGFYLRSIGNENNSLLRWASTPIDSLIKILSSNFTNVYEWNNLTPSSPDMVQDMAYNISYHTKMQSQIINGVLTFKDNQNELIKKYTSEKEKREYLINRIRDRIKNEKLIFVIKSNNNISFEKLKEVKKLLLSIGMHKESFILFVTDDISGTSKPGKIQVLESNILTVRISKLAPYEAAYDVQHNEWFQITKYAYRKVSQNPININVIISNFNSFDEFDYSIHISPIYRYIYFNNPKAGCTTIKANLNICEALAKNERIHYQSIAEIHNRNHNHLLTPSQFGLTKFIEALSDPTFIKISAIRNPLSRLLSAYNSKFFTKNDSLNIFTEYTKLQSAPSFEIFVNEISKDSKLKNLDEHWRPQIKNTCNNLIDIDYILRFETLEEDIQKFKENLGISESVEFYDARRYFPSNVTYAEEEFSDIDETLKENIYQTYLIDYLSFGYPKPIQQKNFTKTLAIPDRKKLSFWSNWFKYKGSQWPDDYHYRLNHAAKIQDPFNTWLLPIQNPQVLDIESGPLTFLGKVLSDNRVVEITATDSLATEYHTIIKENSITPPVVVHHYAPEMLSLYFTDQFDLIISRNALGSMKSPHEAFKEMVKVAKNNAKIWLQVEKNPILAKEGEWGVDFFQQQIIVWKQTECYFLHQLVDNSSVNLYLHIVDNTETEVTFYYLVNK